MRVAVSIRYLEVKGVSHGHIYLYSGDGKLLRQLTNSDKGQDIMPVFSPDGREVAFTRQADSAVKRPIDSNNELWSVDSFGRHIHRLDSPPDWYGNASQNAACFTVLTSAEENWQRNGRFDEALRPTPTPTPTRLIAPDGSFELILDRTGNDTKDYDEQQLGKLYRFRNLQTGEESLVGDWPGFETLWGPLHLRGQEDSYFLIQPPLRAVFFSTHLNSTDGDIVHALDLNRKRVIRLGPNWTVPIPIPGQPSFFVEAEERYVPLGDGKRTVNCSYLDRWDAEFHKIRYARAGAAIFGGASVWRNDAAPLTMHWAVRYE
jgi:hypothetical protein